MICLIINAANPDWSQSYSGQPEIQAYLKNVATRNQLRPHLRFGHSVVASAWDEKAKLYNVIYDVFSSEGVKTRLSLKANILISAMGGLHIPKLPDIKGIETFEGTMFHSAQWRHDVDLKGKTVGIIGNGCSSCQIVPSISEDPTVNVVNFCRTPSWFAPRVRWMLTSYLPVR